MANNDTVKENRLAKGGRPRKAESNIKNRKIKVSLTDQQYQELLKNAETFKMKPAVYAAHCLVNTRIVAPFTEEELKLKIGLVGMANNLNQLAHKANAAGIESVYDSCRYLLLEIKKELQKFRE